MRESSFILFNNFLSNASKKNCSNFFRLSSWLIGIGKSDHFDVGIKSEYEIEDKHFVCSDHFAPHQFLKGTNQVLKRRACPSVRPLATEERTDSSLPTTEQDPLFLKNESAG